MIVCSRAFPDYVHARAEMESDTIAKIILYSAGEDPQTLRIDTSQLVSVLSDLCTDSQAKESV